jgi:hypothetical protein
MPAVSDKQRKAAGMALSAKRGKASVESLKGAAKDMYETMSEKELEKMASMKEEKKEIMDEEKGILTDLQRTELKKVIDTLVEEQVESRQKAFIEKYTKFIVENATSKITKKYKTEVMKKFDEELKTIRGKLGKFCRSVVVKAEEKVIDQKQKTQQLIESFEKEAPKFIKTNTKKQVQELAEESIRSIEETKKYKKLIEAMLSGLYKVGYVINEDIDKVIEKERNTSKLLKTELLKTRRDLEFERMTEGMLPEQKAEMSELLNECTTYDELKKRFPLAKKKVFDKNIEMRVIREEKEKDEKMPMMNEEMELTEFLKAVKNIK